MVFRPKKPKSRAKRKKNSKRRQQPSAQATATMRGVLLAGILLVVFLVIAGLVNSVRSLAAIKAPAPTSSHDAALANLLDQANQAVAEFEQQQLQAEDQVLPDATLNEELGALQVQVALGQHSAAQTSATQLNRQIRQAQQQLRQELATRSGRANPVAASPDSLDLPILLYHVPPPDFGHQLDLLREQGYTTITPDQLADGLHQVGQPLPLKPVLITFDDGLAQQMSAFADLKQRHMKATFYIISGGKRSRWCIGASRRYHDPAQPPAGCGDSYLTWSQIKQLDDSGLITIGAHTVDHEDLPTDPPAIQKFEIDNNLHDLESHLGHKVDSFAYPYGDYDDTTVQLVQAAGFTTAVTTNFGTTQTATGAYTLSRIRSVYQLP